MTQKIEPFGGRFLYSDSLADRLPDELTGNDPRGLEQSYGAAPLAIITINNAEHHCKILSMTMEEDGAVTITPEEPLLRQISSGITVMALRTPWTEQRDWKMDSIKWDTTLGAYCVRFVRVS